MWVWTTQEVLSFDFPLFFSSVILSNRFAFKRPQIRCTDTQLTKADLPDWVEMENVKSCQLEGPLPPLSSALFLPTLLRHLLRCICCNCSAIQRIHKGILPHFSTHIRFHTDNAQYPNLKILVLVTSSYVFSS